MSHIFLLLTMKMVGLRPGPTYCRQKNLQNQVMNSLAIYQYLRHSNLREDTWILEQMFRLSDMVGKVNPDNVSIGN
jgi:hypothetical protein